MNSMLHRPFVTIRGASTHLVAKRFFKRRANRPVINTQRERNAELDAAQTASGLPWRMMSATILHRYPVITKDRPEWETDLLELQEEDLGARKQHLVDAVIDTPAQLIPSTEPTYDEILDSMPFKPAPRVTEADEKNDRRSTERRLQDSLFLIVKRNRPDHQWQFPQGKIQPEENYKEASQRVITRAAGKINTFTISNAPSGHYLYQYPDAVQKQRGNFGAKTFFYRTQLIEGTVKLETKLYTDYAWIARDELKDYFDPDLAEYLGYLLPN